MTKKDNGGSYLPRVGAWQFIPNVGVIVPQEVHGSGEHSVWAYQVYKEIIDGYRESCIEFFSNRLSIHDPTDSTQVAASVQDFMERLDASLTASGWYADSDAALRSLGQEILERCSSGSGYCLTDDAAQEILRKAPPAQLVTSLGCRNVREMLERMPACDALSLAVCVDPAPYPDVVLDVIEKCAEPSWFSSAAPKLLVIERGLRSAAEPGDFTSAVAHLCGRVATSPTPGGADQLPATSFMVSIIRGAVASEMFTTIFRDHGSDPDSLGTRVATTIRGHWGRYVASAFHIFANRVDRGTVERLRMWADVHAGQEDLAPAVDLVRAAADVYHLSITLPDATFIPLCAGTWADFRRRGGKGIPTPIMARAERDWTTSDFFSLYLERSGLAKRDAVYEKANELVAAGRQSEDLRSHFFSQAIDPDDMLVRQSPRPSPPSAGKLTRPLNKPLLAPNANAWESRYVLNAGVIRINGTIYILYRAFGDDEVSRVGLAWTKDGLHIDGRLDTPVFTPGNEHESAGCEDVRTVQIGDRIYMVYTAWDRRVAQIAMASIGVDDFVAGRFDRWERHGLAFPGLANKDAALYPERINGQYVAYHRIDPNMWVSYLDDLTCPWPPVGSRIFASPRTGMMWDGVKIGAGGPPIKTTHGWLNIYHGVDYRRVYRLGVMFMALDDPARILYRSPNPILEPEAAYELGDEGSWVPRVVFTCGAVPAEDKAIIGPDDEVLVYYGAADTVIGVATGTLRDMVPEIDEL